MERRPADVRRRAGGLHGVGGRREARRRDDDPRRRALPSGPALALEHLLLGGRLRRRRGELAEARREGRRRADGHADRPLRGARRPAGRGVHDLGGEPGRLSRRGDGATMGRAGMPTFLTALALAAAGAIAAVAPGAARTGALPPPPPPGSGFVRVVDNPWFPLVPGTMLVSRGEDDGVPATDVLVVTRKTRRILGIRATVVHDRVFERGRLVERTLDYYAQDQAGNVWYLGEDTATLRPNGRVESTGGTFHAGVRGARAGVIMPAHPRPGDRGWQEYFPRQALDRFLILRTGTAVATPALRSRRAMVVQETTPLEPGVVDHKVYVRGIGVVREETVKGGSERYELVSVRRTRSG